MEFERTIGIIKMNCIMSKEKQMSKLLSKVAKLKKEHKLDLSSGEDLSIAVMNLISLEEHFFFTGAKTGKSKYYDMLKQVREMRKDLLKKIVKDTEGEEWCISKHLLATSMRLIEVGTKYYSQGKKQEAEDLFSKAYDLYSLFWGLNLDLVKPKEGNEELASTEAKQEAIGDKKAEGDDGDLMGQLNDLVEKLIDCCEE